MSRILLLLVFLLWMAGTADAPLARPAAPWPGVAVFLGFYAGLVLLTGVWGRVVARRVAAPGFYKSLRRFHLLMFAARIMVPAWFGVGVFGLGWGWAVEDGLGLGTLGPVRLPGLVLGALPAVLAWVGLWWSQYPTERALREQHVWAQLEDDTPVHAPPSFREYFVSNLRLQVLFTLVPVLLIVAVRDVVAAAVFDRRPSPPGWVANSGPRPRPEFRRGPKDGSEELIEFVTFLGSAGVVFLFAPEVLRRILSTSPLPDGPLRRRLEALGRRTGMRYRDILVWHTQYNMGNAAVMGVVPRMRYVLLSDLLLERMDDDQIEAVFAHEVGHVVHRHMVWYVLFFLTLLLATAGPVTVAADWLDRFLPSAQWRQVASVLAGVGGFWLLFGFLSRRFERQADVYAARVIESARGPAALPPAAVAAVSAYEGDSYVGPYGARLFASALHRVAVINNIPVSPRPRRAGGMLRRVGHAAGSFLDLAHDWLHGSIPTRMAYLHRLSSDPALTGRFDQVMVRLYCTLLFCLFASAAWTWMTLSIGR